MIASGMRFHEKKTVALSCNLNIDSFPYDSLSISDKPGFTDLLKHFSKICKFTCFNLKPTEVHLWCFARFGNICKILKTWKTTKEECYF